MTAQTYAIERSRGNGLAAFRPDTLGESLWFHREDGDCERFRLDSVDQCLWRRAPGTPDRRVPLTPKAFAVLSYLVDHAGRLITHNEFLDALWPDVCVQPEVLKHQILSLRTVLQDDASKPRFIETLIRRGYRFIARLASERGPQQAEVQPCASALFESQDGPLAELRAVLQRSIHRRQREIVFVTGPSGAGKTSLIDEFVRRTCREMPQARIARGQCMEGCAGKEAYYPVLEALGDLCRAGRDAHALNSLAVCAPSWLVQFPALLPAAQRPALQSELAGATRERMPRELKDALERLTHDAPLVLVLEDLQWVDRPTAGLIEVLARARTAMQLLLIGTYRPAGVAGRDHPLQALLPELRVHRLCSELPLDLSPASGIERADQPEVALMQ